MSIHGERIEMNERTSCCANLSIVLHSLDIIALDPSLFLVISVIIACKSRWVALSVHRQSRTGSMAAVTNELIGICFLIIFLKR